MLIGWMVQRMTGTPVVKAAVAKVVLGAAAVALVTIAGLSVALYVQTQRVDALTAQRDASADALALANDRIMHAAVQVENARRSSTEWEALALEMKGRLETVLAEASAQAERDRLAVARAQQAAREADAAFAAWMDRYQAMVREQPDCAAIEEMVLCPID